MWKDFEGKKTHDIVRLVPRNSLNGLMIEQGCRRVGLIVLFETIEYAIGVAPAPLVDGCKELARGCADSLCQRRKGGRGRFHKFSDANGVGAVVFHDDDMIVCVQMMYLRDRHERCRSELKTEPDACHSFHFEHLHGIKRRGVEKDLSCLLLTSRPSGTAKLGTFLIYGRTAFSTTHALPSKGASKWTL